MCGIIGYNGSDDAIPYLVEGIRNLEYRGYDSFGCALQSKDRLIIKKGVGRVDAVIKKYKIQELSSSKAIFHTRWATTGLVRQNNAHPFRDCSGRIAVVHNGIIDNWAELRASLTGHKFSSNTDTEVLAHLVEDKLNGGADLRAAVEAAFFRIRGSSSFVVLDTKSEELVAVKKGSPLVLGISKNGNFISSDVPSFVKYTDRVVYLSDGDMVEMRKDSYSILNLINPRQKHAISKVNISAKDVEKGEYKHFMLKEIMEQQGLLKNIEGKNLASVKTGAKLLKKAHTAYILGAGTSFHVAMICARKLRENGINAIAVQGQDIVTYSKVITGKDVFVLISQSGETADIINILPVIQKNKKIGIINSTGSTLGKEVDLLIPIDAGPEKAVAATKTFTLSAVYCVLLAMYAAGKGKEAMSELKALNMNMYNLLVPSVESAVDAAARRIKNLDSVLFLGRDFDYMMALEGALKLKEISYIHAEAIDAATFKHGPLAMISASSYAIALVSPSKRNETMYNLQEVKARKGKIIGLSDENSDTFDMFIRTQKAGVFSFVMQGILLQLLAYRTSVLKGLDVDRPRNLAKSVTVL